MKKTQKQATLQLKPILLVTLLIGMAIGYQTASYIHPVQASLGAQTAMQVDFSPGGHCTQLVEETIAKAQHTILVQAYSFTSRPIAAALIAAHQRGVKVKILVDRSQLQGKYTQVKALLAQGIPVAVDQVPGIAHNKVMIIDEAYVLTGSFNWTQAAECRNAENLLLIQDQKINQIYKANWDKRALLAQEVMP